MTIFSAIICFALIPFYHYQILKIYQLSYYRVGEFISSLKNKGVGVIAYALLPTIIAVIAILARLNPLIQAVLTAMVSIITFVYYKIKAKTKLRLTHRTLVFLSIAQIIFAPTAIGLTAISLAPLSAFSYLFCLWLAHLISSPIFACKNRKYIEKASKKLARINPLVIGITGSYGKTTLKNALGTVLSQKYTVVATPQNYNTTMGVARAINENLAENTQIFIAEMGARYVGDIAEICSYFPPDYAVITAVGNQHLQTFGSSENILKAKGELIDGVGERGITFINGDNPTALKLCARAKGKLLVSGRQGKVSYQNVRTDETGSNFTLNLNGEKVEITSSLIGEYAPSMLAQCALIALELGLDKSQIINGIKSVKAVAHRLELLYNGIDLIIDDSYNANESGAKQALTALSKMNRTRIVVTPGIVELGYQQAQANYRLGELCARCADYAIFLGVNKAFLERGALDGGMNAERIKLVKNLSCVGEELKKIKGARAILFENDLPENY